MKSRIHFAIVYCTFFILVTGCQHDQSQENASQPNFVFIIADDQTYDAVRALGNEEIWTPHLDRLVEDGTTFTHAFNMGGWHGAVCVASRTMLISGHSIWRAREFAEKWEQGDTSLVQRTWGRLMSKAGYDTYMTGKWHVTIPAEKVFGDVKNVRPGMPRDHWPYPIMDSLLQEYRSGRRALSEIMPVGYHRPTGPDDNSWHPADTAQGGFWAGGQHWSEVVKEDAIHFLEKASEDDDPFFMYLAFNAPHDPRQAPQSYLDQYPLQKLTVRSSFLTEYPFKDAIGCGPGLRDEALAPFPRSEYAFKKHNQEYYAIISHMDKQVGDILDHLEAKDLTENTYVIFTADHGLAVGQHGLYGKQNMYDHSLRVPLMISGPGIPKGKKVAAPVYLQDILPTVLELAGTNIPEEIEFNSLLSLLNSDPGNTQQVIYGCYRDLQRMIRKDDYKLIVYPKIKKVRLYNHREDPYEINDLSENPDQQEMIRVLMADLVNLQETYGDDLVLDFLN